MATHYLTRWHVSWFPGNNLRPAHAYVILHGRETHFLKTYLVSESFRINLEPNSTKDNKATKALVKRAMELSENKWTGRV